MLNRSPIILNCFSRGGSNILWNIFLSHPEVCSPIQETLEIFRFDRQGVRRTGVKVAWLTRQLDFFYQWKLRARKPVSGQIKTYIDRVLFEWKMKTLQDDEMRYKFHDVLYTRPEVEQARIALKNNNGLIFLSDLFAEMYPHGVFFGLVREPVSLYESHKRRKTPAGRSPRKFAYFYRLMIQKLTDDATRWDFYHIVRFEDFLQNPIPVIQRIYSLAGLDIAGISQMRFKAKPHMQADGSYSTPYEKGRHYWFDLPEIPRMFEQQVNRFQVSRLPAPEAELVRSLTCDARLQVGYSE